MCLIKSLHLVEARYYNNQRFKAGSAKSVYTRFLSHGHDLPASVNKFIIFLLNHASLVKQCHGVDITVLMSQILYNQCISSLDYT